MTENKEQNANHVVTDLPEHFKIKIVGKVQHRVGDGVTEAIPLGQEAQVDVAMASMVVSWVSEGQPVTVTVAREEFLFYVDEGAIKVVG